VLCLHCGSSSYRLLVSGPSLWLTSVLHHLAWTQSQRRRATVPENVGRYTLSSRRLRSTHSVQPQLSLTGVMSCSWQRLAKTEPMLFSEADKTHAIYRKAPEHTRSAAAIVASYPTSSHIRIRIRIRFKSTFYSTCIMVCWLQQRWHVAGILPNAPSPPPTQALSSLRRWTWHMRRTGANCARVCGE
jgi:hypothetical protein